MRGKVWTSILLVLLLAFCLLSGCAGNEQPTAEKVSIKIGGSSTMAPIIAKCADNFTDEFKTWDKVDAGLRKNLSSSTYPPVVPALVSNQL